MPDSSGCGSSNPANGEDPDEFLRLGSSEGVRSVWVGRGVQKVLFCDMFREMGN